jgi:hypothetical protein
VFFNIVAVLLTLTAIFAERRWVVACPLRRRADFNKPCIQSEQR